MLRFHIPLVEPDVRFSRIRLSDKALRFRPRKVASPLGQSYQPQPFVQELVRELPRSLAALLLVFSSQPLTKPPSGVSIHRPIGFADPTQAEVIGPSHQHLVQTTLVQISHKRGRVDLVRFGFIE